MRVRLGASSAIALAFACVCSVAGTEQRPGSREMLVAAAASLSDIAPQLAQAFHDASGVDVRFNFAGSNTLARQIVEGARVDVFISADEAQMDIVEHAGRTFPGTRVDVIANQLVVIVSTASSSPTLRVDQLATSSIRRVAMGDPAAVPAGVYGRKWLEAIRLWGAIAPKVIPLPSSPSVLAAVAAGRADVGIVYLSDVTNRGDRVRIAHRVALQDAPRIVYPAAVITSGRVPLAQEFISFLRSARAQAIFAAAGFRPLAAS